MPGQPMSADSQAARKSSERSPLVRGAPVVRCVLEAALAELARAGYGALRIEDVAARAGVNKTTVYRRYPTKEDLVRAAILSMHGGDHFTPPNTGSLRTDLLEIARRMTAMACSAEGQGLARMMFIEGPDSELMAIARSVRESKEALPRSVLEAAAARGELAPGIDAMLLFHVMISAVRSKLLMDRERVDDGFLTRLVDLLLLGALAPGERAAAARAPTAAPRGRARSAERRRA